VTLEASSLVALAPMVCVTAAAIAAMTAEAFRTPGESMPIGPLGYVGLIGAAVATFFLWDRRTGSYGVVVADNFGLFVTWILILIGLLSLAASGASYIEGRRPSGEYYALMLFAIAGMILMAMASDLLVIFLALEVLSLAVYVLTGIPRDSPVATEAAFKYFLLGAFSSAFFLYGIAFTYGLTGSTRLDRIASAMPTLAASPTPLHWVALGLLMVGFAFKVSAVPFHMWTPDAYEGAPSAVTGFMSAGVKTAAFAAFVRVFPGALAPLKAEWIGVLQAVAVVTMIGGTIVALVQTSIKRMLAYSSIAHGGYVLVALTSVGDAGKGAVLFYLLTYAVANLGAFGVVASIERLGRPVRDVKDFAGLSSDHPLLAALMTIFLLSLGGIPPLGGFVAKWYVFTAAIQAGYTWLAVVGVLTSVVAVYFYLRVVVMMYMTSSASLQGQMTGPPPARAALVASAAIALYLGILPAAVLDWAARSITSIF
jgi:NADH-quinone oxidoreductase subunit N